MKLTLIRGLPGSGKSTIARSMQAFHVEADMYFIRDGKYQYDPTSLGGAHAWCTSMAKQALEKGLDVVVTNTFTRHWEMDAYTEMAQELGATVEVVIATGTFKDVHGVPPEAMARMRARFQP